MPSQPSVTEEPSSPLDQASHLEPCVPGACLDSTPLALAILVLPPELDRTHRPNPNVWLTVRYADRRLARFSLCWPRSDLVSPSLTVLLG